MIQKFGIWQMTLGFCFFFQDRSALAVTWQQQAQRLQNVNATLIDASPLPVDLTFSPSPSYLGSISFQSVVSLLPKPNSTVGSKNENVPSAPVHTVPQLGLSGALPQGLTKILGLSRGLINVGYLPMGSEKLMGLKVKFDQWLLHAALAFTFNAHWLVPLGFQYTSAFASGPITETNATDRFSVQTVSFYTGVIYVCGPWGVYFLEGFKRSNSVFEIPSDQTKLKLTDTLSDSTVPLYTKLALSYQLAFNDTLKNVRLGLAEHFVPKRAYYPQVFLNYEVNL